MNGILISKNKYTPVINTDTVLKLDNKVEFKTKFLQILNYLSEFITEKLKELARENLGVLSDITVLEIINEAISNLKGDVSVDYDTLLKLETIIKLQAINIENNHNYVLEELDKFPDTVVSGLLDNVIYEDKIQLKYGINKRSTNIKYTGTKDILAATLNTAGVMSAQDKIKLDETIPNLISTHTNNQNNPHYVTKSQIGLGNLTNDAQVKRDEMGVANGVATLNEQGLVPSSLLPSFVDDVVDCYATYDKSDAGVLSNIKLFTDEQHQSPIIGEPGKIYVDIIDGYQFRWTGTIFVTVGAPTVIGEITGTAFDGGRGKVLEDKTNQHIANTDNPHNVTCELIGAIPKGGLKTVNGNELEGEGNIDLIYNADDILFTSDLVITADVGVHTIDSSGSKTLPTTGKSVKQVMDMLFAEEKNPTITQPYVNITLSGAGIKEVGTMFTPSYSASLNPGSYQYGPATGVTVSSWNITDTNSGSKDTATGSFAEFQVIDSTNYKVTAVAQYTDGVIPNTNLENPYEAGKIIAGSKSKTSSSVTGYRNSFYGTLTNKNELTSDTIRALTKSNKALANSATFNIIIPVGALRVVIAYPATLRPLTSVLDVNGLNAEIVTGFKESRLNIEGLNSYQAIEYRVYILDFANPNDKGNTYKVTI